MLTAKGLLSACPRSGTIVQPTAHWKMFDTDILRWLLGWKLSIYLQRQFTELHFAIKLAATALAARTADEDGLNLIRAGVEGRLTSSPTRRTFCPRNFAS